MNIQAIDLAGFHMMEAHIYHTYCKTNKITDQSEALQTINKHCV